MSMLPSGYQLPIAATMAGLALAASGLALTSNSTAHRKKKRRTKAKYNRELDGGFILGLVNTGNSCFLNSVLQSLATLPSMRTYLAERVEPGDEAFVVSQAFNPEFIQASVAFALYRTIEALNKPLTRPHAIVPREIIQALERKTNGSISRQQQDAHELFQIVSSALTAEEEQQFREAPATLFDANLVRSMAMDNVTSPLGMRGLGNMDLPVDQALLDKLETSSISSSMGSVSTMGSMWSAFSVSTVGGYLRPRSHRPRNPFTGLAASKVSCLKCEYTAAIRHSTFDNLSLTVPQQAQCTLEDCLDLYTRLDTLDDFQCRRCTLIATLAAYKERLESVRGRLILVQIAAAKKEAARLEREAAEGKGAAEGGVEAEEKGEEETKEEEGEEKEKEKQENGQAQVQANIEKKNLKDEDLMHKLEKDVKKIEDALKVDVERFLPGITLITPPPTRTTKHTMIANPPRALCLHLSRSVYQSDGTVLKNVCRVTFSEKLDLSPFTTTGHLSTKAEANLSGPPSLTHSQGSDWYHRKRLNSFSHTSVRPSSNPAREGLSIALGSTSKILVHSPDRGAVTSPIPSVPHSGGSSGSSNSVPAPVRSVQYRLQAVVVHYGSHESGHFVAYRRKKLPTGDHVPHVMIGQVVEVGHIGEGLSSLVSPEKKPSRFWQVSDEEVLEVDLETVMNSEAYMLFYERE